MTILNKCGFDFFFTSQVANQDLKFVAKVISVSKLTYKVISYSGDILTAILKGSELHYNKLSDAYFPKVGDFILLQENDNADNNYYIKKIFERKNSFKRKLVGKSSEEQIIATNIDIVFIVIAATEAPNLNKIDRIILACKDEKHVHPIIILNKIDLFDDYDEYLEIIKIRFPDIQIIVTSKNDLKSINSIYDIIKPNKTAVLIGSSGVGKSTLTNMLLKQDIQKVSEVSNDKSKGTHTTTQRELFILKEGGCIIDNPGIKEFGIYLNNNKSLYELFPDIIELSLECKFTNCNHISDEGCAILKAIKDTPELQVKFDNFIKLKNEVHHTKNLFAKYNKNFKKKKIINKEKIKMRKKVNISTIED